MKSEMKSETKKPGKVKKAVLSLAASAAVAGPVALPNEGPEPYARVCEMKPGEVAYINTYGVQTRARIRGLPGAPLTRRLLLTAPVWREPSWIYGCGGEKFNAFRDEPHYCYEVVAGKEGEPRFKVNGEVIQEVLDDICG